MLSEKEVSIYQKLITQRTQAIVDAGIAITLKDKIRYQKAESQYSNVQAIIQSEFADLDAWTISGVNTNLPKWPHYSAEEEVAVSEEEVRTLCADLECRRKNAIGVAEYALETRDYSKYLNKQSEVSEIDRLLKLHMFEVYRPDTTTPAPEWDERPEEDIPFDWSTIFGEDRYDLVPTGNDDAVDIAV